MSISDICWELIRLTRGSIMFFAVHFTTVLCSWKLKIKYFETREFSVIYKWKHGKPKPIYIPSFKNSQLTKHWGFSTPGIYSISYIRQNLWNFRSQCSLPSYFNFFLFKRNWFCRRNARLDYIIKIMVFMKCFCWGFLHEGITNRVVSNYGWT